MAQRARKGLGRPEPASRRRGPMERRKPGAGLPGLSEWAAPTAPAQGLEMTLATRELRAVGEAAPAGVYATGHRGRQRARIEDGGADRRPKSRLGGRLQGVETGRRTGGHKGVRQGLRPGPSQPVQRRRRSPVGLTVPPLALP
jgi:hypothetical protein